MPFVRMPVGPPEMGLDRTMGDVDRVSHEGVSIEGEAL